MKHNIQNASPFATKQLGSKLNNIIEKNSNMKKLTLTETITCTIIALASLVFVGALILRLLEVVS